MAVRITRMTKRRLGELLRAEGLVTEEQVRLALAEQRKACLFLGEALVRLGFVTEDAIAATIAQQFNLPFLTSDQYESPKEMLEVFPESILREYQFLVLDKIGKELIILGAGLMNHDVLAELERLSGCRICQYVGTWNDIQNALERLYRSHKQKEAALSSLGKLLLDSNAELTPPPAGPAGGAGAAGVTPAALALAAAAPAEPAAEPTPVAPPAVVGAGVEAGLRPAPGGRVGDPPRHGVAALAPVAVPAAAAPAAAVYVPVPAPAPPAAAAPVPAAPPAEGTPAVRLTVGGRLSAFAGPRPNPTTVTPGGGVPAGPGAPPENPAPKTPEKEREKEEEPKTPPGGLLNFLKK